jgi:hypothetical protein
MIIHQKEMHKTLINIKEALKYKSSCQVILLQHQRQVII